MKLNKPIVLVPGFCGSKLIMCNKRPNVKQKPRANDFINLNIFDKQWDGEFVLKFDPKTGRPLLQDNIETLDFGGVEGIRNLCESCLLIDNVLEKFKTETSIDNVYNYRYFDSFISRLESAYGYKSRFDLFGAPYDFRKIGVREYMEHYFKRFQGLLEQSYEIHRRGALVLAHSIGALIIYVFLCEYMSPAWKSKYIDRFISVSAPFGGCSVSLKTCLSGYPRLMLLKDRYFPVMHTSTGISLAFPNLYGYNDDHLLLLDRSASAKFHVTDFMDALPDHMRKVWESNGRDLVPVFMKNTGVATSIITASEKDAELMYLYETLDKTENVEPQIIAYGPGDMLIPSQSLNIHERHRLRFPNYTFHDISGTEHTKVLSDPRFLDIVTSYV